MKKVPKMMIALGVALCGIIQSQAVLVTAGELIVDLRNEDLSSATNTWLNHAASIDSVGEFATKGGGNANVIPALSDGSVTANGLYVNQNTDHAMISSLFTPSSLESNSTCSVEAWIWAETLTSQSVVSWGNNSKGGMSAFRYNDHGSNGKWSGWYVDSGWDLGSGVGPVGEWVYIAYTYDGTSVRGYINGALIDTDNISGDSEWPLTVEHRHLNIGASREGATSDPFDGYIADVRVHTGVLGGSDVANNYSEGMSLPSDLSPQILGLDDQSLFEGEDLVLDPLVTGADPKTYDWSVNGTSIVSGVTDSMLTVTGLTSANNGEVYTLIANNSHGSTTNSMTVTVQVLPNYGPKTVQFDFDRGQKYIGKALAPGPGTAWNYFDSGFAPITSVTDSSGNELGGMQLKITSTAGTYGNGTRGSPNPHALMDEYVNGSATFEITALPAGEYDLYFYGHGDQADQGTTVSIDVANGADFGVIDTTGQFGDYRNIYSSSNGPCYVILSGSVETSGESFTFTSSAKTCGFQLQNAAPAIEELSDQLVFAGTTNVVTPVIAGRASTFSYQWSLNGSPLAGETSATLTLINNDVDDSGGVYELIVNSPNGSDTNSFILTVFDGNYDEFQVNLQLDCNSSNAYEYAGTAISTGSGTEWIQFYSPTGTVSSVSLTNVVDAGGNATDYDISILTSEGWNIYTDVSLGNPNPTNLMADYLYQGPYIITVSNLPPGDYNLYVYAHGDQSNQVSTITVDAANGGDTGATTGLGEYRNIYQTAVVAEGNSYVSLTATVSGSGTLAFSTSDFLNGFQLQRVTIAPIVISGITVSGGTASISWSSEPGTGYSIDGSPSLAVPSWTSKVGPITSVGSQTTDVSVSGDDVEFFRISK